MRALLHACLLLVACGGASAEHTNEGTAAARVEPPPADAPPTSVPDELSADPAIASRQSSDWVVIGGVDVALSLPRGWHRLSAKILIQNRQQRLRGGSRELTDRAQASWSRTLQVAATERPLETSGGLVPTVQVQLRQLPPTLALEELCALTAGILEQSMQDVHVTADEPAQVGPLSGRVCGIRYILDTANGPMAVEVESYFVLHEGFNMQISFSGPPPVNRAVVNGVLSSMRTLERL